MFRNINSKNLAVKIHIQRYMYLLIKWDRYIYIHWLHTLPDTHIYHS